MLTHWYLYSRRVPVYKCNRCKSHVGTRHHCILCDDFDLCFTCFNKAKHPHTMKKLDVHLYDSWFFRKSVVRNYQEKAKGRKSKKFMKGMIRLVEHSSKCKGCIIQDCTYFRQLLHHGRICKFKNDGKCPIYDKYFEILKCHCTLYCTKADFHCPSVHL